MSEQYSEKIFKSIEEIVSARLNEVSFDKTIECTILERFEEEPSKYWATNGSINIEVYASDDKEYKVNDKVYVVIPNGDYASRKIIIGRYNADDLPKYLWSNPFDSLIYESKINVYEDQENPLTVQCNATEPAEKVLTLNNIAETDNGYNYIGLEMSFAVWLSKFQGEYRIEVILQNKNSSNIVKDLVEFSINSTELYGNPYQLTSDLKFYHLFSYPEYIRPKDINQITIRLVSAGGFSTSDANATISMPAAALYFGYDVNNVIFTETNKLTMSLGSGDKGEFDNTDPESKMLYLQWVKDKKIYSYLTSDEDFSDVNSDYKIKWYTYQYGVTETEKVDDIGGSFWVKLNKTENETLEAKNLQLSFTPRKGYVKELIKAVIVDNDNKIIATSNVVELNDPAGPQQNPDVQGNNGLKLIFDKQNHFVYNSAGRLDLDGTPNQFGVSFKFDNESLVLLPGDQIIWEVAENDGQIQGFETTENDKTVHYTELKNTATTGNIENKEIFKVNYSLKTILTDSGNTRVSCTVKRNNQIFAFGEGYVVTGNRNTQGTGYIFNIDFAKDSDQYITSQNSVTVEATLYRPDGTKVELGDEDIVWSWYSIGQRFPYEGKWGDENVSFNDYTDIELFGYEDTDEKGDRIVRRIGRSVTDDKNNTTIYDEILGTDTIILRPFINSNNNWYGYIKYFENNQWIYDGEAKASPNFCNNYHVLMAQYKNASWATSDDGTATTTLSAYLPIPWGSSQYNDKEVIWEYSGPDMITYNPSGTEPNYRDTPCVLKKNGEEIIFKEEDSCLTIKTQKGQSIYGPEITKIWDTANNKIIQNLKPRQTIIADNPMSCISIRNIKNQDDFYQHPIFIARNTYMFDSINKWSGQLQINEANNSIMAGFIVAGKKDMKTNKFTGVIMGNMAGQDSSGNPKIRSGIIGQKEGQDRFYLESDGSFWFGNNKGEKITFDNNGNLIIKCNNMDINSNSFTLEAGGLLLTSRPTEHSNYIFKFSDKLSFENGGSATIGGWSINNIALFSGTDYAKAKVGICSAENTLNAFWAGYNSSNQTYKFRVTDNGELFAAAGDIAGWSIGDNSLSKQVWWVWDGNENRHYNYTTFISSPTMNGNGLHLNTDLKNFAIYRYPIDSSSGKVNGERQDIFYVRPDGFLYAKNAHIEGKIISGTGKIGGWSINENGLFYGDDWGTSKMGMCSMSDTGNAFWAGYDASTKTSKFRVTSNGELYATAGTIGGCTIDSNGNLNVDGARITSGTISGRTISGGSIIITNSAGNVFKVNRDGYLLRSDSASIGSWNIGSTLFSNGTTLDSEGVSLSSTNKTTWQKVIDATLGSISSTAVSLTSTGNTSITSSGQTNIYGTTQLLLKATSKDVYLDAPSGCIYARSSKYNGWTLVKTDNGSVSSRSVKDNIVAFEKKDYEDALKMLKQIDISSYDYKYNLYSKKEQYGFIIDDIKKIEGYNKFFDFTDQIAAITKEGYLDFRGDTVLENKDLEKIQLTNYNSETFTKYLLVCIKALQQEIEVLKGEKGE